MTLENALTTYNSRSVTISNKSRAYRDEHGGQELQHNLSNTGPF